jgi:hypothetical protein
MANCLLYNIYIYDIILAQVKAVFETFHLRKRKNAVIYEKTYSDNVVNALKALSVQEKRKKKHKKIERLWAQCMFNNQCKNCHNTRREVTFGILLYSFFLNTCIKECVSYLIKRHHKRKFRFLKMESKRSSMKKM